MREASRERLKLRWKVSLALRTLVWFLHVHVGLRRRPLPHLVQRLARVRRTRDYRVSPVRLGRGIARILRLGSRRSRCLVTALVHFRLLREQGERAELVIGLPAYPTDKNAHAWVEIDSVDVGPPPGRGGRQQLARFG
jgi:Transglutaminase-like superfamily